MAEEKAAQRTGPLLEGWSACYFAIRYERSSVQIHPRDSPIAILFVPGALTGDMGRDVRFGRGIDFPKSPPVAVYGRYQTWAVVLLQSQIRSRVPSAVLPLVTARQRPDCGFTRRFWFRQRHC